MNALTALALGRGWLTFPPFYPEKRTWKSVPRPTQAEQRQRALRAVYAWRARNRAAGLTVLGKPRKNPWQSLIGFTREQLRERRLKQQREAMRRKRNHQ